MVENVPMQVRVILTCVAIIYQEAKEEYVSSCHGASEQFSLQQLEMYRAKDRISAYLTQRARSRNK